MLTAYAAVLGLAATPAASLSLVVEITSPKTRLSIFEPAKLTVRVTATSPVAVPGWVDATGYPLIETWIDSGHGFARYIDDDGVPREGVEGARRSLATADSLVETVVLVNGLIDQAEESGAKAIRTVPFPNPGRYLLLVVVRLPHRVRSPGT